MSGKILKKYQKRKKNPKWFQKGKRGKKAENAILKQFFRKHRNRKKKPLTREGTVSGKNKKGRTIEQYPSWQDEAHERNGGDIQFGGAKVYAGLFGRNALQDENAHFVTALMKERDLPRRTLKRLQMGAEKPSS